MRLSQVCNNRCRFCHDRSSHDGSLRPYDDVLHELREGRAAGAQRAVLSGGEPTLHPRLPDAIRHAHRLGYRWVQIVTNGRRLAYPAFFRSLLDAGLDEVTFSLHGSTAAVHDDLVGVPGAFDQTLRGLRAALATRSLVVSVDVVLNRRNLADAPQLVRRAVAEGVREFDLLWLVPFGAAGESLDHPDRMFLEPDDAPAVRRTIDAALDAGATVWTNRMPLPFLEGIERLAQDPSKMEDELRGRRVLLEQLVSSGRPLDCREPGRCARCPIESYCDLLHAAVARARAETRLSTVRLDPADHRQVRWLPRIPYRSARLLWLRTQRATRDWDPAAMPAVERARAVRLDAPDSVLLAALPVLPARAALQLRPRDGAGIPPALAAARRELVVPLSAPALRGSPPSLRGRAGNIVLAFPDAAAGDRLGWPFGADARPAGGWLRAATAVEGIPRCLAGGRAHREAPDVFDLGWLDEAGHVDPFAVLRTFVNEGSRTRSFRCRSCAARRGCPGLPWAMARRVGLAVLRPPRRRPRRVP